MKALKVLTVVLVVGLMSVSAFGQDTCATAVAPGTNVDTCAMARDAGEPDGSCWTGDLAGGIAWYTFTATDALTRVRTDVECDGTDSEFAVYNSCADLTEIACSEDDADTCSDWLGDICVPTTSGSDYVVTLSQWTTGACGNYALDVSTGGSVCGDGIIACDSSEDCDGPDMGDCELGCRDCKCKEKTGACCDVTSGTCVDDVQGWDCPVPGTTAARRGQGAACSLCSKGDHFVDTCLAGQDTVSDHRGLVGIDYTLDCVVDTNLIMEPCDAPDDVLVIDRSDPVNHWIDTEIVSMCLKSGDVQLKAGLGQGGIVSPSLGSIVEQFDDPARAYSFFDVFFEVDLGGGNFVYNHSAARIESKIDCIPPRARYIKPTGCVALYTDPVGGVHVANLVTADHRANDPDNQFRWEKDTFCSALEPPCEEHTGACCDEATGICEDSVPASECTDDPSDPEKKYQWGKDVLCADILCEPKKGCCVEDNSSCVDFVGHEDCVNQGGHPVPGCLGDGDGSGIDDACEPKNPCCLPDGSCHTIPVDSCKQQGGKNVDSCDGAACPPCEIACQAEGKVHAQCAPAGPQRDNRRPVARLVDRFDKGICTAWLIGAPNCIITNNHCITGTDETDLYAEFNYECDCAGMTHKPVDTYWVTKLIHANAKLDYAILKVKGNPATNPAADPRGTLRVDAGSPKVGAKVYIIHHGEGKKKAYHEGAVKAINVPGEGPTNTDFSKWILTAGGASGSPTFNMTNHCVAGLHYWGAECDPTQTAENVPMSLILADALPHLQAAGCAVEVCEVKKRKATFRPVPGKGYVIESYIYTNDSLPRRQQEALKGPIKVSDQTVVLRTKLDFNPSDIHIKYRFQNRSLTQVIHNIWKAETKGGKFTWKFRKPPDEVFPRYRVCDPLGAAGYRVGSQCCTDDSSLFGCQDGEPCSPIACPPEVLPGSEDDEESIGACCLSDGGCMETTQYECDSIDKGKYQGDGAMCENVACTAIPAVSEWGLVVTALLMLAAGTIVLRRRGARTAV